MHLPDTGWARYPADDRAKTWARAACEAANSAVADPANAHWHLCEGTWFAGVNVLDTCPGGDVDGVPLSGPALDAIKDAGLWPEGWDRAQVSVVYPGYPRPRAGESHAAFRYRRDRDAAHVDGLLPVGRDRRRMAQEFHGFILGLPLAEADPGAAPFVIWEGSHLVMLQAFRATLGQIPPETWSETDLTNVYHAARREVFERCRRVAIHAAPGEAYLVHRMALHGVGPWQAGAVAGPAGRMIAYFRPEIDRQDWLIRD